MNTRNVRNEVCIDSFGLLVNLLYFDNSYKYNDGRYRKKK